MDFAALGQAVDRFHEVFPRQLRRDFGGLGVFDREEADFVEPVEPSERAHLKRANWAVAVVEDGVWSGHVRH